MPYFNIVAETNQNTVVTEYEPVKAHSDSYESEAALEKEFIRILLYLTAGSTALKLIPTPKFLRQQSPLQRRSTLLRNTAKEFLQLTLR